MKRFHLLMFFIIAFYGCQSDETMHPSLNSLDRAVNEINLLIETNKDLSSSLLQEQILILLKNYKFTYINDERIINILNDLNKYHQARVECQGKILDTEIVIEPNGRWMYVFHYANGATAFYYFDANNNMIESGCFGGIE